MSFLHVGTPHWPHSRFINGLGREVPRTASKILSAEEYLLMIGFDRTWNLQPSGHGTGGQPEREFPTPAAGRSTFDVRVD